MAAQPVNDPVSGATVYIYQPHDINTDYEQLRHMDIRHFVILEFRHLATGCVLKCGCIGLMLFHNLSCLGTIICYINTIGIVPAYACNVCDALVASYATTG